MYVVVTLPLFKRVTQLWCYFKESSVIRDLLPLFLRGGWGEFRLLLIHFLRNVSFCKFDIIQIIMINSSMNYFNSPNPSWKEGNQLWCYFKESSVIRDLLPPF